MRNGIIGRAVANSIADKVPETAGSVPRMDSQPATVGSVEYPLALSFGLVLPLHSAWPG